MYNYIYLGVWSTDTETYLTSQFFFSKRKQQTVMLPWSGSLGMKLDFTESSTGAQIREVAPSGHMATWNGAHPEDAVTLAESRPGRKKNRRQFQRLDLEV